MSENPILTNEQNEQRIAINTCPSTVEQYSQMSVAVKLKPLVSVKCVSTECCGEPEVRRCYNPNCDCTYNGCEFCITQAIRINVTLEYGATARTGEPFLFCQVPFPGNED